MNKKREVASIVLYRKGTSGTEFFMQKRDTKTPVNSGMFDLFGGGLDEGETRQQALMRELGEELEYVPKNPIYFSRYENATHINNVFLEEVGAGFEDIVYVHEGEYGTFLTLKELEDSKNVFIQTLFIIRQVTSLFLLK